MLSGIERVVDTKKRLNVHISGSNSAHDHTINKYEDLIMRQDKSIQDVFVQQSNQTKLEHTICLKALFEVVRLHLNHGLIFHEHR